MNGLWAFGYESIKADSLWDEIPLNSDIVITHTPPYLHCDHTAESKGRGCESLHRALQRVRPTLAICGHVHEGRGAERVAWDLHSSVDSAELSVKKWEDPGLNNKKQSLLDISSNSSEKIRNDGPWEPAVGSARMEESLNPYPGIMLLLPKSPKDALQKGWDVGISVGNDNLGPLTLEKRDTDLTEAKKAERRLGSSMLPSWQRAGPTGKAKQSSISPLLSMLIFRSGSIKVLIMNLARLPAATRMPLVQIR